MIPKIIHYCWLSDDPLPDKFTEYLNGWKSKLEGYEFIKWDFTRFPKDQSIWVKEAFDNKKYAFAADYIRLYAVFNYGGIYLDLDVELLKPFDDLLSKPYMFAKERKSDPWIEAGCFGAEKGNKFIGLCLERYKDRHFVLDDGSFDQTILPVVMEKVREQNNIHLDLYSWEYFTAKLFSTGEELPTSNTYTIHHFAGSWKTEEEKKDIERMRKLSKIFGARIGRNIVEYQNKFKKEGIIGVVEMTKKKLLKKIRRQPSE